MIDHAFSLHLISREKPISFSVCFAVLWTPLVTFGHSPSPRCGHSLTAVTAVRIVLYGGRDPTCLSDMHLLDYQDGVRILISVELKCFHVCLCFCVRCGHGVK